MAFVPAAATTVTRLAGGLLVRSPVVAIPSRAGAFAEPLPLLPSTGRLAAEGVAGSTAAIAVGYGIGKLATYFRGRHMDDSARSSLGKRPAELPEPLFNKRRKMDQLAVAAGGLTTRNRYQNKQRLRGGRIGRKLDRIVEEYIQRWQRIYPFGQNDTAYPSPALEEQNPGTSKVGWNGGLGGGTVIDSNTGRLMLSHVAPISFGEQTKFQLLPGYLFDITSWNNTTDSGDKNPVVMKRLAIGSDGRFQFVNVAQQGADADFTNDASGNDGLRWFGESGPAGVALPNSPEQRAVLAWNDIRMNIYGAKKRCSKIHIEFIQFVDPKYQMNFHPDGEPVVGMTQQDQNDVQLFWLNEFKRLTFNPLVVNTFIRKKAIKVMKSETFCVNADETTNQDPGPPVATKQYFRRYNRLVKWNWQTSNLTLNPTWVDDKAGGMEDPDFQVTDQAQMVGYAHPNARVFLYIRAEDFEPVSGVTPLYTPQPAAFHTLINGAEDPAPPGGSVYPKFPTSYWDGTTETGGNPFASGTVEIASYVPVNQSRGQELLTTFMPQYLVPDRWASDDHVSFDIIVRNKWKVQI